MIKAANSKVAPSNRSTISGELNEMEVSLRIDGGVADHATCSSHPLRDQDYFASTSNKTWGKSFFASTSLQGKRGPICS